MNKFQIKKTLFAFAFVLVFVQQNVDAQISKSFQLPSANGETCNVVNLNFDGNGDSSGTQQRGMPGSPGKKGAPGQTGPSGPRGQKGDQGMEGKEGRSVNVTEITTTILKILGATSCNELCNVHGVSSSGYYWLRINESSTPEYTYCDFELRVASHCWEIAEEVDSPTPGYYLIKSNSSAEKTFIYCATFRKQLPRSCQEVSKQDAKIWKSTGGVFDISPDGNKPIEVYCDLTTDGGGWTVFQRREDGTTDFYRNWNEYVQGFGDKDKEMWLGLETIHQLTSNGNFELRIDLMDWSRNKVYAKYSTFSIASGSDNYRLAVTGYSGTAGDSLTYHNGQQFSTKDADHDSWNKNCALQNHHGAWWYKSCAHSNLNGVYYKQESYSGNYHGIYWYHWKNSHHKSMKFTEMKFRRKN